MKISFQVIADRSNFTPMGKTALLIGATGLVGEECLNVLLNEKAYDKVIALTRRPLKEHHPKLENIQSDFSALHEHRHWVKADDIFCAIGTTIGKAGSQKAFRVVDFDIPLQLAEIAKANGAKKFLLVSSIGADPHSVVFYSRVKGELEEALTKLKFNSLIIFRPSILLGNRKEKRTGESIGRFFAEKLSFLFAGPLKKYRGTPAHTLALKMVQMAQTNTPALCIVENDNII